jgi:hypothetical protein
MENLISLIIDLLTALFGRSKEDQPKPPANRPDPSRPRPQPGPTSWENELRRLLDNQGQAPPASAPPPARPIPTRPPPIVVPQAPRVITVSPARPVIVLDSPPPAAPVRVRPVIVPPSLPPGVLTSGQPLATLSEAQLAYARASQLDKAAAARIERVPGQEVQLTTVVRKSTSPEVTQVLSLFKNPQAARQAVIAAIILGPPRAFEERTSANF